MGDRIELGHAVLTRVREFAFDITSATFAKTPPEAWRDNADLLVPTFVDPETGRWRVVMQSWVVEAPTDPVARRACESCSATA